MGQFQVAKDAKVRVEPLICNPWIVTIVCHSVLEVSILLLMLKWGSIVRDFRAGYVFGRAKEGRTKYFVTLL